MKNQIAVDSGELLEFLTNWQSLIVPRFQRSYAWEETEVEEFVEDIENIVSGNQEGHFFGSIVLVDKQKNKMGATTYEVIDGQQRLSTFFILLVLLKNAFQLVALRAEEEGLSDLREDAIEHHNRVIRLLVWGDPATDRREYKLQLSQADKGYFREVMDLEGLNVRPLKEMGSRDSHRRIYSTLEKLSEMMSPYVEILEKGDIKQALDGLIDFYERLYKSCTIVEVKAQDRDDAYELFQVLNDRGKSLGDFDLLRQNTLERADRDNATEEQSDEIANCWDEILQEERSADKLLKAYYTSRTGARPKKSKIWKQYLDSSLWGESADPKEILQQVKELRDDTLLFHALSDATWPLQEENTTAWDKNRLSRLIKTLDHTLCIPLLLAAASELDEETFAQVVFSTERYAFRAKNIGQLHVTKVQKPYDKNIPAIRKGTFELSQYQADLDEVASEVNDDRFALHLSDLTYGTGKRQQTILYLLTTIEDFLRDLERSAGKRGRDLHPTRISVFDLTIIDVEHIYPQNATTEEQSDELEDKKHTLGNLSYWSASDNRSAQNRSFSDKKDNYMNSEVQLTRRLAEKESWTVEEVEARQQQLVDWAVRIFST